MTREEYRKVLLNNGFKFEKTTLSYPGWRGDEDIYTHKPLYKFTFRVFRLVKDKPEYGLYVGVGDQFGSLDNLVAHNLDTTGSSKSLPVWTGDAFLELMNRLTS